MDNLPIFAGLAAVLVLFLLIVVILRRGRRKKKTAAASAPSKTTTTASSSASESAQSASLTSLIGQAKVAAPPVSEQKAASLRQITAAEAAAKAEAISRPPTRLVQPGSTGNKIRILIVDDNKETREHVSRLLAFETDMEVVGQAYNGISGLELAHEYEPHIVLMDINMPDMDGITATREMALQVPYCQVIIISVQFEQDYMRSAMLAGARDYQTKPFSADELVNCIRRVYKSAAPHYKKIEDAKRPAMEESASAAFEVAVVERAASGLRVPLFLAYSPRGGTGVSAISINLAAALDQIQHGVALFDTDLQFGDLPVHLNMRPTKSLADLTTSSRPDAETLPDLLLAHSSGVQLLFAPPKPETAELITGSMLVQAARRLRDRSSAVVIDTGSYLTDHNLALFDVVSLVLLIITPDLASVKSARVFCDMAPHLGLPPERIVLVLNRANMVGGIPAAQIEKALGVTRVFSIPDDPKLRYSSVKGATVFQLDANAPAAQAIAAMARSLWDLINAPPKPVAPEEDDAKAKQAAAAAKRA